MELADRSCTPDVVPIAADRRDALHALLEEGWRIEESGHLVRVYTFPVYEAGLDFINRLGMVGEEENHHPDMRLARREVRVDLWSYAVKDLSENDFILAAKSDQTFHEMTTVNTMDVRAVRVEAPSMVAPLSAERREQLLAELAPGWHMDGEGFLVRTYQLADFITAMQFVNRISSLATERRHHPGIHVGWKKVTVRLWTWPASGVTESDFEIAKDCDTAYRWATRRQA